MQISLLNKAQTLASMAKGNLSSLLPKNKALSLTLSVQGIRKWKGKREPHGSDVIALSTPETPPSLTHDSWVLLSVLDFLNSWVLLALYDVLIGSCNSAF